MRKFYRQALNLAMVSGGRWLAIALVLLSYGLMVSSAVRKSGTVDEQSHLFRGVAYLKTGAVHFELGHPILGGALSGLPLLTEPDLALPTDHPAWAAGDWSVAGDLFLWALNDHPLRLIFLGRLPVIWLTALLAALLFRWGREMAGSTAALMALALLAFDPNVLAHGRLVTGDLPLSVFFALAVFGYWHWLRQPGWRWVVVTGLGAGLAAATKFNAALLAPVLGVLGLLAAVRRKRWQPLLALLAAAGVAWLVVWVVYGFAMRPLPGGAFWNDLKWELRYFELPHGAYLAGQYSSVGWWYYFPIAFLVKTPLTTLILLGWAMCAWGQRVLARKRAPTDNGLTGWDLAILVLPPVIYIAASLTSRLNIGYRYLLPALPFLILLIAASLSRPGAGLSRLRWLPATLVGMQLIASAVAWPNYIPYFNLLAGGAAGGWRVLSDSNVDWGQDLPALQDWQLGSGQELKLSYFGMAHPSAYGIRFESLPTWSPGPEQARPDRQTFNPRRPAPGWYAISVTNLHGAVLGEARDTFAWFRDRQPTARIGGSIFLYQVELHGEPIQVGMAGLTPADLDPELMAHWGGNDVRVRWFDARTSMIWPADGGWLVRTADQAPDLALQEFWPAAPARVHADQLLFFVDPPAQLELVGASADYGVANFAGLRPLEAPPNQVALITAWRAEEVTDRPLRIYVHALNRDGAIVGQWDGLDVASGSWQVGDLFLQLHRFAVPLEANVHHLAVGLYDGQTLERLGAAQYLER